MNDICITPVLRHYEGESIFDSDYFQELLSLNMFS
jgi:hypothetical protein